MTVAMNAAWSTRAVVAGAQQNRAGPWLFLSWNPTSLPERGCPAVVAVDDTLGELSLIEQLKL
jgi:hypothetical protein